MSIGLYFFKSEVTLLLFGRCMFKGGGEGELFMKG